MATRFIRSFRGKALSNCIWITNKEFQQLNQDLYERFHAFNSPWSSFPKLGGVDGDKWKQSLKAYHKGKGVIS